MSSGRRRLEVGVLNYQIHSPDKCTITLHLRVLHSSLSLSMMKRRHHPSKEGRPLACVKKQSALVSELSARCNLHSSLIELFLRSSTQSPLRLAVDVP